MRPPKKVRDNDPDYKDEPSSYLDKQKYHEIIFNEDEIIKEAPFNYFYDDIKKITYLGLFLPKWWTTTRKNEEGEDEEIRIQVRSKYVINSERILLSLNQHKKQNNVVIPQSPEKEVYPLRWELKDIECFLYQNKNENFFKFHELLEKIEGIYKKYLYFSQDEWYTIHALWDIGTYFYQLFDYYPLMELRGLKGTGKTKLMTLSRQISFMASEEMTNPSAPTLFRWTNDVRGTKYIDEAEKLYVFNPRTNRYESDERAELINSGFKKTGTVPRQEKFGNRFKTIFYKTYSPTICASINGLYGATEDRALIHIMTKTPYKDNRGNLDPNEKDNVFVKIRNTLYRLTLEHSSKIYEFKELINIEKLRNRDKNIWHPILTIASFFDYLLHQNKGLLHSTSPNEEIEKMIYGRESEANEGNEANSSLIWKRIYSFAKNQQELKKIELVDYNSNEYKILKVLGDLIVSNGVAYIGDIKSRVFDEGGKELAIKTISSHLDKMGFMSFKKRKNDGTCYELSFEQYKEIGSTILGKDITSLTSFASLNNNNKEDKDKNKEVKLSEANEVKKEFKPLKPSIVNNYFYYQQKNNPYCSYSKMEDYLTKNYECVDGQLNNILKPLTRDNDPLIRINGDKIHILHDFSFDEKGGVLDGV